MNFLSKSLGYLMLLFVLYACGGEKEKTSENVEQAPAEPIDTDNDGVVDEDDQFPLDSSESQDTDGDGIGNNADTDDDNDGIEDSSDAFPLDAAEVIDTDNDGIGNNADMDDDNDGVADEHDAFPLDASETVDTDNDGIGDNADGDDDGDGVNDEEDSFPLDDSESQDLDNDGVGNNADLDDDGDGVNDEIDLYPLDKSESQDSDGDGIGNNADTDDDNDGVADEFDAFPFDASESLDTDSDGVGNNRDNDDDGDGVDDERDRFPLDGSEAEDADNDGIGNNADTDDDNDGVADKDDAFPFDTTESKDTDGDGIGNNADDDDDGDGYPDTIDELPLDPNEWLDADSDGVGNNSDALPHNPFCSKAVEVVDGRCIQQFMARGAKLNVMPGNDGVIYFYIEDHNIIAVYDTKLMAFYDIYFLEGRSGNFPNVVSFSKNHNRIYLGYKSGYITYVPSSLSGEFEFASLNASVIALADAGTLLQALDREESIPSRRIFDIHGELINSVKFTDYAVDYAWDENKNRLYYLDAESSSRTLWYRVIDQITGELGDSGSNISQSVFDTHAPIRVSSDGELLITGSGDVYFTDKLRLVKSIDESIKDALWLQDNELVTVAINEGVTEIKRFDTGLRVIDKVDVPHDALAVIDSPSGIILPIQSDDAISFYQYHLSDDSDGDSVVNARDAFPLDIAASVDADNDGYPDQWNVGFGQADSTTGLSRDAYPDDSVCYLIEHGDGMACDYDSVVPNYEPEDAFAVEGIIYLVNREKLSVFRWSIAEKKYLKPLSIGTTEGFATLAPRHVIYSGNHKRLYLGYANGLVSMIDLEDGSPKEENFVKLDTNLLGIEPSDSLRGILALADVGNSVLVSHASYDHGLEASYTFSIDAVEQDSFDMLQFYGNTVWDNHRERLYYYYDRDPVYIEIDQISGHYLSTVRAPYVANRSLRPPIHLSQDGRYLLFRDGELYLTSSLMEDRNIGVYVTDAYWKEDGSFVSLQFWSYNSLVKRFDENFTLLQKRFFDGEPQYIFQNDDEAIVVSLKDNRVIFHTFTSLDDIDGDGVEDSEDAFPNDIAASVDVDQDGYPDAWNAGYSELDSEEGLIIDAHPNDPSCYLPDCN